tara:strand:- start:483 stop:1064 length:582 start_codon:yes stop_codon:yes gene_type:complete
MTPFLMEFDNFEEVVGKFTGDPSIIDQSIDDIYLLKKSESESDGYSNVNGWQKDIDPRSRVLYELKRMLLDNFSDYLDYYECRGCNGFGFQKFFVNVNPPNAYHTMHHHNCGEFSGAFWLKSEPKSGNLFLLNPYPNSFMNTLTVMPSKDCNVKRFLSTPNTGVFFNSNLIHYVDVNRSESDRISIAYHIKIY